MPLARDVTAVGSATLLSRVLGFLRDVAIAAVLGAGAVSDAYFAALQIPNLARRLLAEGALNAAFVPMWLRIKEAEGEGGAWRFAQQVGTAMLLAAGIVVAFGFVLAPLLVGLLAPGFATAGERAALAIEFLRLSLPYAGIAAMVAVLAAVLNAERRVGAVSLGVVVFNAVMLAALAGVLLLTPDLPALTGAVLCHAVVAAGFAQFAVTAWAVWRLMRGGARPASRPVRDVSRFFARAVPGLVAAGIPQLTLIMAAMVASSSPNAVSWLYYANRLYELPLGVVAAAVASVMVPLIAASLRGRAAAGFAAAQSRACEVVLALALPAAAGLVLLAPMIAGVLFERGAFGPRDTEAVALALAAMCVGLPGHALDKVLGAVAFAHDDTRTPMLTAAASLLAALVAALALVPAHGHVGAAIAIAVAGWSGALMLGAVLYRRGWLRLDGDARRRLPRIVLAAAGMVVVILLLQGPLAAIGRVPSLAILIALGLATYAVLLQMLRVARLADLVAALRKSV